MSTTLSNQFNDVAVIEQPELISDSTPTPVPAPEPARLKRARELMASLGFAEDGSILHDEGLPHSWRQHRYVLGEMRGFIGDHSGSELVLISIKQREYSGASISLTVFNDFGDIAIFEATAVAMINAASNAAIP